jgi:uroporphyrinogen-III synthase
MKPLSLMILSLKDKLVVITRPKQEGCAFETALNQLGATCFALPTIQISKPESWQDLDHALLEVHKFAWVFFTSQNAVLAVFQRLQDLQLTWPESLQCAVIGDQTATIYALKAGREADFQATTSNANMLADSFSQTISLKALPCWLPLGNLARPTLQNKLEKGGALITRTEVYQTHCLTKDIEQDRHFERLLHTQAVDVITFHSSSAAHCFYNRFHNIFASATILESVVLLSIGSQTTMTLQTLFPQAQILEALTPNHSGMQEALCAAFSKE